MDPLPGPRKGPMHRACLAASSKCGQAAMPGRHSAWQAALQPAAAAFPGTCCTSCPDQETTHGMAFQCRSDALCLPSLSGDLLLPFPEPWLLLASAMSCLLSPLCEHVVCTRHAAVICLHVLAFLAEQSHEPLEAGVLGRRDGGPAAMASPEASCGPANLHAHRCGTSSAAEAPGAR